MAVLTAVSCLPAPGRDVLRAYLTTGLPAAVLAALFGMAELVFCEALVEATYALEAAHSRPLTPAVSAVPTRPAARQVDAAATQPAGEVA